MRRGGVIVALTASVLVWNAGGLAHAQSSEGDADETAQAAGTVSEERDDTASDEVSSAETPTVDASTSSEPATEPVETDAREASSVPTEEPEASTTRVAEPPSTSDPGGPRADDRRRERPYWLRAVGEIGFLAVLDHRVQFGEDGTYFDYRAQGAQDTLFLNGRVSLELGLFRHHQIVFLYQPLAIRTENVLSEPIRVDALDYPAGTPMTFTYDFPFYRLSYMYDFFARRDLEVAIGLTFQIRNTTIAFASRDGTLYRAERDVGFVPALKLRVTYHFPFGLWIGTEIDGIYAPVSYLNGSDEEIVGAILDASLRAGIVLPRNVQVFLNVRYLGGGAVGTDEDDTGPGDGYVRNWLHFLTVTLGVTWDIL